MGINFDDVDDLVNCGSGTSLDNLSAITISAWIYPATGVDTYDFIIGKRDNNSGWHFQIDDATTRLRFLVDASTDLLRRTNINVITLDTWQHVLVTWDGVITTASSIHIYVNGSEVTYASAVDGVAPRSNDSGETCYVGAKLSGTGHWNGNITEVAIWNAVLTAGEIALLASSRLKNIPIQIQPSALKLYLPMDEGTHGNSADLDTAWDWSGNGNNGNPDNGANNTGCTWSAETILNYPQGMLVGL